jgi:hypothetical protein
MATGAAPEGVGPAVSRRPLSVELAALQARLAGETMQLHTILEALQGRAFELLMVVLVLPFAVPVSVPGMSTPFGVTIAIIAAQLALARMPWLPGRVLRARIPAGFLTKVLAATKGVVAFLERFLRARLPVATRSRTVIALHFGGIIVAALLLAVPLPVPLTNVLPGWAILLIALGLMERDGLFIAAGHIMVLASLAYFALLGESARQTVDWLVRWLHR